eukprot:CAMPEP_0194174800 /NCGR_PEP_ID=MMETSP0154-20130528/8948_1 /TAXON_ID=1049557 /ORGANISM="Thalassiothrix antarctica, Strain L6-D1" /LENGTH=381 /DNA_ID=CAMNT_0038888373 /DNA_START=27 /DNA_END=1169 /DNA_ORIENTATION=+
MSNNNNYKKQKLSPSLIEKLEAGAFRSLCRHLSERSDEVQNIDLMTVSGFCRNCLAKWMVVEARNSSLLFDDSNDNRKNNDEALLLDAFGYDEAGQYVYGCEYGEWKKRHAKKASEEQIEQYNASKNIHSLFDKKILEKKVAERWPLAADKEATKTEAQKMPVMASTISSNVCCQYVDDKDQKFSSQQQTSPLSSSFSPPPSPQDGLNFSVGILIVSDRAYKGEYPSGDLSGPAIQNSIQHYLDNNDNNKNIIVNIKQDSIVVPDEIDQIQSKLLLLTLNKVDLILTAGGTGFSIRDVTPEATTSVDGFRECYGLMSFISNELTKNQQPLACLSRGKAGIIPNTAKSSASLVCNLPGSPKAIKEIIPMLFPILIHAIGDLQ